MVALTLLVLKLTDSGFAVGLLTACQFGPILLLSAWAGVIADRSDKRRLLFVTQSLEMVQSFVLGALAFMGHPPLAALFGTALAGGVLLAFDNPIRRSFVAETVELDDLPNAVTLYSAMVNTSRIFGPALAGALVVTLGYGWCFTIDAFSYLTVLAALWAIRPRDLRRVPVTPRGRGQVRAGLRYVRDVPALRITFVMLAVIGTLTLQLQRPLPALRDPRPARQRRQLHGRVLGVQRGLPRRRARGRAPQQRARPLHRHRRRRLRRQHAPPRRRARRSCGCSRSCSSSGSRASAT